VVLGAARAMYPPRQLVWESALSIEDTAWAQAGYVLAFAGLLLVGGHLCDLVGRRPTLLAGLTLCVASGAVSAFVPGIGGLLGGQVLQGASAALVTPAALGLYAAHAGGGHARIRAFGAYALVGVGGPLFAIPVVSTLDTYTAWRVSYFVFTGLAVVVLIAAAAVVRDGARRSPTFFDTAGVILGSLGFVALGHAITQATPTIWNPPAAIGSGAAGVLLLAVFFRQQSRTVAPLLPPYVWREGSRRGTVLTLGLVALPLCGVTHVQLTFSHMGDGLGKIVLGLLAVIVFLVSGRVLAPRVAGRVRLAGGLLCAAGGMLLIGFTAEMSNLLALALGLLLCSAGLGLSCGSLFAAATEVRTQDVGAMAAMVHAILLTGTESGWMVPHPWIWWGATALLVTAAATASRSLRQVTFVLS
jgi:hypothetical protein